MKITQEQQDICNLVATGKNLLIEAGAGCAKTTTGKFIAQALPDKTCLSIFFNKKNAEEGMAQADRPSNMYYSTIHSLCYRQVMNAGYKSKLNDWLLFEDIDTSLLTKLLKNEEAYAKGEYQKELNKLQRVVMNCIKLWQQSDAEDCYTFVRDLYPSALGFRSKDLTSASIEDLDLRVIVDTQEEIIYRVNIARTCSNLWIRMYNPKDSAKITHDTYVKIFQLKGLTFEQVYDTKEKCYKKIDLLLLDECLTAKQYVKTSQGLWSIKRLYDTWASNKPLPEILSYNIEKEVYEYKPMLSGLKSVLREVYTIKTEGSNKIECTGNHKILTTRGYVPAQELEVGKDVLLLDEISNQKTKFLPGEEQYQLLLGSILGDGCLQKQSKYNTFRLRFTQGVKQLEYLRSKAKAFDCPEPYVGTSGYTGEASIWNTATGTFILPEGCNFNDMDARALAIWYMDDGSIKYSTSCIIHSNGFNLEQHTELQQIIFDKFGIFANIAKNNEYYYLSFNIVEGKKLLELTAPFFHEDLAYKNPYFKGSSYNWKNDFKVYGGNVVSYKELTHIETVYDIEVADNHNFITCRSNFNGKVISGVIVHNCQDSNSVTLSIFNNQTHLQRIACGDKNQNLYAWRGAKNDFSSFASWNKATLTESFRFGQGIADIANKVLALTAMETNLRLIGRGTDKGTGQTAILCRTNATVLQTVFTLLLQGQKVACVSKFNEMEAQMYHVFAVLNEQVPKFPVASLKSFDTKDKMWQAIESNQELAQVYKLATMIADAKGGLYSGLKYLKENLVSQERADYIVSTIHASKGLGFTNVVIADDFLPFKETQEEYDCAIEDMKKDRVLLSLCYVAITRAKESVKFPLYLESLFDDDAYEYRNDYL